MAKTFDAVGELDERAKRREPRYLAAHNIIDLVSGEPIAPDVVQLLYAQGNPARGGINLQYLGGDGFAFLENFIGILGSSRPANVSGVNQAIKTRLDLHERSVISDASDLTGNLRSDRILLRHLHPRIW